MGYDYEITYKKGNEHVVTDALSRAPSSELFAISISALFTELIDCVKGSWAVDPDCSKLKQMVMEGTRPKKYAWRNGLFQCEGAHRGRS